ncbi:LytR/AlgR family response regulator transcription factor [Aquimarina sp. M1]
MKAIIIDDELSGRENLTKLITTFCPQVQIIAAFGALDDALENLQNSEIDIAFLDIHIGDSTIFTVLNCIDDISFEIIFVSAHNEALKAFEYTALDYILKPVEIEVLIRAVRRAELKIIEKKEIIKSRKIVEEVLKNKNGQIKSTKIPFPNLKGYDLINSDHILYCTAEGSYSVLVLKENKQKVISQNLKHIQSLLEPFGFIRIHKSSLVNINYIVQLTKNKTGGYLTMVDGKKLQMSQTKKTQIIEKLFEK